MASDLISQRQSRTCGDDLPKHAKARAHQQEPKNPTIISLSKRFAFNRRLHSILPGRAKDPKVMNQFTTQQSQTLALPKANDSSQNSMHSKVQSG
ncbi:MAG: hypothetical protein ACO3FK_06190, partial [Vulcanococcus sp.]